MNFENAVRQMIKGNKVRNTDWARETLHLYMEDGKIYFLNDSNDVDENYETKTGLYFSYDFCFDKSVHSDNWEIYEKEKPVEYISLVEMIQRNDGCIYRPNTTTTDIEYSVKDNELVFGGHYTANNKFQPNEKIWYKISDKTK